MEWCFLCVGVTLLDHVCRVRRGAMWVMQLVSAVCCAVTRRHSGGPTDCPEHGGDAVAGSVDVLIAGGCGRSPPRCRCGRWS